MKDDDPRYPGKKRLETLEKQLSDAQKKLKSLEAHKAGIVEKQKQLLEMSDRELTRIIEVRIGEFDHWVDISKFFITLSSTALFTLFGIPHLAKGNQLIPVSVTILIVAVLVLIYMMHERRKLADKYINFYTDTRLQAYKSIFDTQKKRSRS